MNWQNLRAAPIKTLAAAQAAPAGVASTVTPAALRTAATYYAARPSNAFCQGKAATCHDLAAKLEKFGSFVSEKQAAFAANLIKWATPPLPATPLEVKAPVSGVFPVPHLFAVMQKHSTFHAGDLKLSRKNQDSLCWIVYKDVVVGKLENGECALWGKRIFAAGALQQTIADLINEFERNPLAAAMKYGKLAGRCCSCGRDLTDPESIERGIGPICAEKFSF